MAKKQDGFMGGAILAVIGLMAIIFTRDLQAGFLLLGLGVAFMASTSPERAQEFFEFMFSTFKELVTGLLDFAFNR
jgi:hypothetical protein